MKILITGGGGFLGAWLIRRLLAAGIEVRIFDLGDKRDVVAAQIGEAEAQALEWHTGDISQYEPVLQASKGCDGVIHLAGVLTPACREKPWMGLAINVAGTLNVFEAAKACGMRNVIYTSSGGVFGPEDTDTPLPTTLYGTWKLATEGIGRATDWELRADDKWHGFGDLADGFNMLDPIKSTIVTPGLNLDGKFDATGIPASIVTKFLAEHGVVVEKTGLYSFFILFTIGITKGRWNTLLTALQQFKDDYDKNQPLWKVLPEFVQKNPRYERVGLRDLCRDIHAVYRANDVARLTTEMYLSDMIPAMKPADAFAKMAHRKIDRVSIDELEGRVTSVLLTPYPPGIPLLIPGERFNRTVVRYLQFAREFNERFPGFETDVHGLVKEVCDGRIHYFVDCVKD